MKMNGGYILVDCSGIDLSLSTAQEVSGIWDKAVKAMKQDKPIIAHGCKYGTAAVSPVTTFGWWIAADEIVIVGATLHCHIKDDDTVTVLDVAS